MKGIKPPFGSTRINPARLNFRSGGTVSPGKAKEILHDGSVHGHKLTDKQKRFFGWKAYGKKKYKDGGSIEDFNRITEERFNPMVNQDQKIPLGKQLSPNQMKSFPKKYLSQKNGIKIYEVDDNKVKLNLYPDFTEGGNGYAYPNFIPQDEIWVAKDKNKSNKKSIIDHELIEVGLMKQGLPYEKAHEIALNNEMNIRQNKKQYKNGGDVDPDKEFIKYLRYNEEEKPYVYDDGSGNKTIGIGHKLTPKELRSGKIGNIKYRKGLKQSEMDSILQNDLIAHENSVREYLKEQNIDYDSLSPTKQHALLDIQYNVRDGISSYPKFAKAVATGDYINQEKEYRRYAKVDGEMVPLGKRNISFFNDYVSHSMAEDIVKERIKKGKFNPIKPKPQNKSFIDKLFK